MSDDGLAIAASGLVRAFGPLRALDDVSFHVPTGQVVALLGHNGAGKTTLLRVINGLLRPTAGEVRTLGLDPVTEGQTLRSRTGVLTEYPALDDFLTVRENLEAYGAMYGIPQSIVIERAAPLLEELGIEDRLHTQTRDLSAGLKQRAALARALIHDPELLLLDEPTSNLDPLAARRVRELVARRSRTKGTSVLVSTHNLAEASAIADRVVVLQQGRVLAEGPVTALAGGESRPRVAITTSAVTHRTAFNVVDELTGDVEELRTPHTFSTPTHDVEVSQIVDVLVRAGVSIEAVVPQAASLEDIYVALHANASSPPPAPKLDTAEVPA